MDPSSNLLAVQQQSGKGSIISGMSLTDIQQQQFATVGNKRRQQSQHLMNIISGVSIPPGQQVPPSNGKPLVKTQSAFLQTQEQLNNLHAQNAEMEREMVTLSNNKRKVTRLKGDKKASRNATQSLLDHPSFKSKNSANNY